MPVEATIDHHAVHQARVGDKIGVCKGVVKRIEDNYAVVIDTDPTREKCYYCTLQVYCNQSMGEIKIED